MKDHEIQDLVKQDLNEEEVSQMQNASGEKNYTAAEMK